MANLSTFSKMWCHPDDLPIPVNVDALDAAEAALASRLPTSFRAEIVEVGLPRPTIALLHCIVENDLDLPDIGEFFEPYQIVETTTAWRSMGLPRGMVAFASDSAGNLFAFEQNGDVGQVYFFDHDDRTTKLAATSFSEWISGYCAVPWKSLEECLGD